MRGNTVILNLGVIHVVLYLYDDVFKYRLYSLLANITVSIDTLLLGSSIVICCV